MIRDPFVSGKFYPERREELVGMLNSFFSEAEIEKKDAFGLVEPHAGYIFSGKTASYGYKAVKHKKVDTFVIIGPNHTGFGAPISVWPSGVWRTPLGEALIDEEFAKAIIARGAQADFLAHKYEHSIEVQLPFLQYLFDQIFFVPICMAYHDIQSAESLASAITGACEELGRDILLIASSDFTHYEPREIARSKDMELIRLIEALDPKAFYSKLLELKASVCGPGPIMTVMLACKELGAKKGELLHFSDSGEVLGEDEVVDYASIAFL